MKTKHTPAAGSGVFDGPFKGGRGSRGCLRAYVERYLLSPVTPGKLGGRCRRAESSLKWLSAPPAAARRPTASDLCICAYGKLGSAAVSTPPPTFGVSASRQRVRAKRVCGSAASADGPRPQPPVGDTPGSHLAAPPWRPEPAARPAPGSWAQRARRGRAGLARPRSPRSLGSSHRIEAFGSAADSAKEPGAASATRGDLTCRISVRGSGFRSTCADLFLKLSSPEAESAVNNL